MAGLVALALAVAQVVAPAPRIAFGAEPLPVSWGQPTATSTYGTGIQFDQPITAPGISARTEILIDYPGAIGPLVVGTGSGGGGTSSPGGVAPLGSTLTFGLLESDGHIVPNTTIHARWRLTDAAGRVSVGPDVAVTYSDTRFQWKTMSGPIVRVHWYEGTDAFASRALAIGEKAIADASSLLGATETLPVDFFIYADQTSFYDALGPGTRENVGATAIPSLRTLFAWITPAEIDTSVVSDYVPHELTHLVFDTTVRNPFHEPPRWLNEGLAVYLSVGYSDRWRTPVSDAVASGTMIPLDGLAGLFPTSLQGFTLAYGESVSAVDFLVRTYGRAALVKLIRSYASGVTDDEAFASALSGGGGASGPISSVAAFNTAWMADLGARVPGAFGPVPAPAGPLPSGWQAAGASSLPSGEPGTSVDGSSSGDSGAWISLIATALILAGLILMALRWRGRPRRPAAVDDSSGHDPDQPGDPR